MAKSTPRKDSAPKGIDVARDPYVQRVVNCTVCSSPERIQIEEALGRGVMPEQIAEDYPSVTEKEVANHRESHLPASVRVNSEAFIGEN